MQLKYDALPLLKQSDLPWIRYKLAQTVEADHPEVLRESKTRLLADKRIQVLIRECQQWPAPPLKRHNDAKHILHKMGLLIDLGVELRDEGIQPIVDRIFAHQAENGAFLTTLEIPARFGGKGEPALEWLTCDFPLLAYILVAWGLQADPRVVKAIDLLKNLIAENGWPCAGSIPKFKGPGRKTDHCPYANLLALQVFALLPEYQNEQFIKIGIDAVLRQWEKRGERKIYLFGIGTDFQKLKYPPIWFDIVHVCRVLHYFPYARKSSAFQEMLAIIAEKQQTNGGFVPESIYTAYKGWDFGQKKEISPTLTYVIWEMFVKNYKDFV